MLNGTMNAVSAPSRGVKRGTFWVLDMTVDSCTCAESWDLLNKRQARGVCNKATHVSHGQLRCTTSLCVTLVKNRLSCGQTRLSGTGQTTDLAGVLIGLWRTAMATNGC